MNNDESCCSTGIADIEKFQIIQFIARGRKPVQKSVDIVPYAWIIYDDSKKKYSCSFPPAPYTNLHEMVKNEVTADPSWVKYTIEIKGQSSTYKEAVRKLNKLEVRDNAFTSDTDCDSKQITAMLEKAYKIRQLENSLLKLKSTVMDHDENSGALNESTDTESKRQTKQKQKKSPIKLKSKTDRAQNFGKNQKRSFRTPGSSEDNQNYSSLDKENNNSRESSTNMNLSIETTQSKLIRSEQMMRVNSTIPKYTHSYQEPIPDDVEQPISSVSPDENPNKTKRQTKQKQKKSPIKLISKTDCAKNFGKNQKRSFRTPGSSEDDENYSSSDKENNNSRELSTNMNLSIETSQSKLIRSEQIMRVNSTIPKYTHSYQKPIPDDVEQPKSSVSTDENPNNSEIIITCASVKNQVIGDISSPRSSTTKYESENTKASTSTHISSQINESLFSLDISPTKLNAMLGEGSLSFSFDELITEDIGVTVPSDQKKLQKPHPTNNPRSNQTTNKKSFGTSLNITHEEYTILLTKVVYIEQEMKAQSSLMRNIEHLLQTKFGNSYEKETLTEKYGTDFPVKTLDDLYSLEKKLSESLKACKDLKSTITMVVDPEEKLSKNMAVVMKKLIGREVAMLYTAIKKMDGKMVFSVNVPTFCSCIVEALTSRLRITEAKVYAAMGTTFTNSKDWDGHRPVRVKKPSRTTSED